MPIQPLPRSQASPQVIADVMVSKYRDGIPLYRQEKIAARVDVPLPRGKLARWIIEGSEVFQVILNLLMDTFFSYDIAQSDDTGCLLYTSPSPRDGLLSRMPSSA